MRSIDADELYEKTAEWERKALHELEKCDPEADREKWIRWSAVLQERSAFKYDIADAPTVEDKSGRWIEISRCGDSFLVKCSECGDLELVDTPFCPECGAKMKEVET